MLRNESFSKRLTLLAALALSACAQLSQPVQQDAGYQVIPVYFATTRGDTGADDLNVRFGSKRADVQYGVNQVAIPESYPKAHSASFIHWNMTLRRDPANHVTLLSTELTAAENFFSMLNRQSIAADAPVLVFIHGFNTPFERAARITAKLTYDLSLKHPPLLFAWPSHDRPSTYPADEDNLSWSQPYVSDFFHQVMTQLPKRDFVFVGHSMGTRALARGLIDVLADRPQLRHRIRGVAFAAPDIDRAIFQRDLAPELIRHQIPMTLYASDRDLAIFASNQLHKYPRAGYIDADPVIMPGLDTIDASQAETEMLGHEYFYQGSHTIQDLYQWLVEGRPVERRSLLVPIYHQKGRYWQIQPELSSAPPPTD